MSKNGHAPDAAAEILTFVINALMAHEKEIDRLINCLGALADDQFVNSQKLNSRIQRIEEKTTRLKSRIAQLKESAAQEPLNGEWRTFQQSAANAESVTFAYRAKDRTLQVEAHKNGYPVSYCGEAPTLETLLKTWLSKNLKIVDAQNVVVADEQSRDSEADSEDFVAFTCEGKSEEAT